MAKMSKQELMEMLKDPEVLEGLKNQKDNDNELDDILADIEVTDDDDLASVSKKYSQQIAKLVKYFTTKVDNAEKSAVEKATADTRKKEDAEIAEFAANNPGMENDEVVALMQQLYDKGKPLDVCYAAACRALELDPTTGKSPDEESPDEENARLRKEAKDKLLKKRSSAKTDLGEETDLDDEDEDEEKPTKPMSIEESLASASADYIAKNGNPFDKKE